MENESRAVEDLSGTKSWYLHGKLHRIDGPAVEYPFGTKEWYLDGKLHRVDGPAIESSTGTKKWFLDDKLHRTNGPAIEWTNGIKDWFFNGRLHRIDGPAVEYPNGTKVWYLDGRGIDRSSYYALLNLRKFRSKILRFNYALGFNFVQTLKLSRRKTVIEWYYSPTNGGGKLAKKRLEQFIGSTDP